MYLIIDGSEFTITVDLLGKAFDFRSKFKFVWCVSLPYTEYYRPIIFQYRAVLIFAVHIFENSKLAPDDRF